MVATQNYGRDQNVELLRRLHAGQDFDVALMPRCDVQLRGFGFADNGTDLELQLRAEVGGMTLDWVLLAGAARSLRIDLDYGDRATRMPLTWDVLIDQDRQSQWLVMFDFASHGELRFECAGLTIARQRVQITAAGDEATQPSAQFLIVLDSEALDNPDTDLAWLLPEAIESRSNGLVVFDYWAYDAQERMHLYFRSAEQHAGLAAIQEALAVGPVCGNDLCQVIVASRLDPQRPFVVRSPTQAMGAVIEAIADPSG